MSRAVAVIAVLAGLGLGGCSQGGRSSPNFPAVYRVVYSDVMNGVHQWEVLTVHRPFEGSDLYYSTVGMPTSTDEPTSGSISSAIQLFSLTAGKVSLASGRQPGPPTGDQVLYDLTPELEARGLAVDLHTSETIAGLSCRQFRFADPPAGPVGPIDLTVGHDDICLDSEGLVLAETWTYHGSVVETRTAVEVADSAGALAGQPALPVPSTSGVGNGGPGAATVTPVPSSASLPVPTGFQSWGSPVSFRLPDPQDPSQVMARTQVWAFVAGARVITVEAGAERGGTLPWAASDTVTTPLTLRGLGPADLALRSDGPEIRVALGDGQWVRIRGTVPIPTLTAYAQQLPVTEVVTG